MDLIIVIILIALVIFFFRRFSSCIYALGIIDIFFRIIAFIKTKLVTGTVYTIMNKYIPASIPALLAKYSSGLLYDILFWLYFAGIIIFEFCLIRNFFTRRK